MVRVLKRIVCLFRRRGLLQVWEASGHVAGFSDPMVDCKESKLRYRADQLFYGKVMRRVVEPSAVFGVAISAWVPSFQELLLLSLFCVWLYSEYHPYPLLSTRNNGLNETNQVGHGDDRTLSPPRERQH